MTAAILPGTSTTFSSLRVVAAAPVVSGDLLVNSDDGVYYKAHPLFQISQNNLTTSGYSGYTEAIIGSAAGAQFGTYARSCNTIAYLGNQIVVMSTAGTNGAVRNTGVTVFFRLNPVTTNPLNAAVSTTGYITISSDVGVGSTRISTLVNTVTGTFAIAWVNGSNQLRYAIYNNDGTVAVATQTVATLAGSAPDYWSMDVLTGGNLVFGYYKTGGNAAVTIYNSAGTIVGSEVTIEAASNPRAVKVFPLQNGNFVYYYCNTASSNYKFGIYSSTGTTVTAIATIRAGTLPTGGSVEQTVVQGLPGVSSNIMMQVWASPNVYGYVYTSSGTLVKGGLTLTNTTNASNDHFGGMCATQAGFSTACINWNASTANYQTYDVNGIQLTANFAQPSVPYTGIYATQISSFTNTILLVNRWLSGVMLGYSVCWQENFSVCCPPVGVSVVGTTIGFTFTSNGGVSAGSANINGTGRWAYTPTSSGTNPGFGDFNFAFFPDGTSSFHYSDLTPSTYCRFRINGGSTGRKSIAGVALEPANANAVLRIATTGSYTLNRTFIGNNTQTGTAVFNNKALAVTGCQASLIGNQITMI